MQDELNNIAGGASDKSDRAVVNGAASVPAVPASVPSAIVLVRADDPEAKPLLYACPRCGRVHSPRIYLATEERSHQAARDAAENCYECCTHYNCKDCGCETPKGWTRCRDCTLKARLEVAVEVPDDGGPYCAFDGDTYYTEMEEAADAGLEWVSPCHVTYPKIDADSVLENLLDDMHEDASVDDLAATDAFVAAVKAFNDAQTQQSWFGDVKRKIRVPAQAIEAGTALRARGAEQ